MYRISPLNLLLLMVYAFLVGGCGATVSSGSNEPLSTPVPLWATPTVNMAHAKQALETGGELTYEEVIALRLEIVGDHEDLYRDKGSAEKTFDAQVEFMARLDEFTAKLEKCKLKETIGWVARWAHQRDAEYKVIPDKNLVVLYLYNPFAGLGKDLVEFPDYPEMYLVYFTDKEVGQFRHGQRLTFSGDLLLVDGIVSVENPNYSVLEDDPTVPKPTLADLNDLEIRLDRTECYGLCPAYTLTITSDGTVTFEGRNYTRVRGSATTQIDKAKLEELAMEVQKADFFGLRNRYSENITDSPTYTLSVQMGDKSKTVINYATGPRRLYLLQDRIDQIVNSDQWVRCDPEPCPYP